MSSCNADTVFSGYIPFSFQERDTESVGRTRFGPLARLGLAFFPDALISLRVDTAYVSYTNTVSSFGQTFDLGISGLTIRRRSKSGCSG